MKYLGIDFGLRRVGLAISEGNLASPLKIIQVKGFKDAVEKVVEIAQAERFDRIVVGLPEGNLGQTASIFVEALKKKGFDVDFADETLSSQKALTQRLQLHVPQKKRRFNDDISAAIILQDYLDTL